MYSNHVSHEHLQQLQSMLWHCWLSDKYDIQFSITSVGIRHSMAWPHHTSFQSLATLKLEANVGEHETYTSSLASSLEMGRLQDGHLGLPFTVQHGSGLPGRWLSAGLWRRSSSAAFCRLKDLCCQADLEQLWKPMSRGCCLKALKKLSSWS